MDNQKDLRPEAIKIPHNNRALVNMHLKVVRSAGAVSIYLYGKEYGYFLKGKRYYGIIQD